MLALLLLFVTAATPPPVARWTAPPPSALSACAAVTAADLESALGRRFGRGQEESRGAQSTCDYGAGNGLVSITIQRLSAKLNIPAEIASLKASIEDTAVRKAPEFGDAAFYLDIASAGTQLHVIRGDRDYVMVSILGFGDAKAVSAPAERLVRAALARM